MLFYKTLTQREEVLSLFQDFSEDGKKLTLLELVDFLRQEQLEDEGTEELAMELIDKYEPSETGESQPGYRLCSARWGRRVLRLTTRQQGHPQPHLAAGGRRGKVHHGVIWCSSLFFGPLLDHFDVEG